MSVSQSQDSSQSQSINGMGVESLLGRNGELSNGAKDMLHNELKDAQVVLLGEPNHGVAEAYEYMTKIVKYLHQEKGFSVLAFESGVVDCAIARDSIRDGKEYKRHFERSVMPFFHSRRKVMK